jgi:organic radical activating enzyme
MLFGGEPLLHPDILKVVNRLGKSIYPLQIFTNLHVSKAFLKQLCSIRDDLKFFASFHHEYANDDLFMEKVNLIKELGAQIHVKVMWDSTKKDKIKAIYEKFSQIKTIDMIYHPNQSFTDEDRDWYIEQHRATDLNRYNVDGDMLSYHEVKVRMDGIANFQGYHCEAGRRNLMVCSNGDIHPCLTYRKVGHKPLFNITRFPKEPIYFVPNKCKEPECYSEIGIPKYKIKEPKMVCLVLGGHCNWDCGYCDRPKIEKPRKVNLKLLHQFYPRIIEWAKDCNVHISGGETGMVDRDALDFVFSFDKKLIIETNGLFFNTYFDKYNNKIQKVVYHCVPELDKYIEWHKNDAKIEYLIVIHHKNIHLLRDFVKKYDKKFVFQYFYPKFLGDHEEYALTREDYFTLIKDFPDFIDKREIIKRISLPDNIDELRKECSKRFDFVGFDFVNGRIKFCKQSHSFTNYVELNEENFDLLVRDKLENKEMDGICKTCTEVVRYF